MRGMIFLHSISKMLFRIRFSKESGVVYCLKGYISVQEGEDRYDFPLVVGMGLCEVGILFLGRRFPSEVCVNDVVSLFCELVRSIGGSAIQDR